MTSESDHHKKTHERQHDEEDKASTAKEPEDCLQDSAAQVSRTPKNITITDIELENLKKELAEQKDKYLRVLAESENARKRLQKEKLETVQYAKQNVIVDFLSPIDHMENALKFTQQMFDDVKHWAIGFQMILSQFKDALSNNGVTPFESLGKHFDPHRHEAVEAIVTDDVPPGRVIEESLLGYIMGDKVIRPARVKVSKAKQKTTDKPSEIDANDELIDGTIEETITEFEP